MSTGFEVWAGQQTWFWFVASPAGNGGTIGAAATEGQAVRDACASIEEMSSESAAGCGSVNVAHQDGSTGALKSNSIASAAVRWEL